MPWTWHAAHIRQSQTIVIGGIFSTLEVATQNQLRRVSDTSAVKLTTPGFIDFYASSTQDGWTTFWGGNPEVCLAIIHAQAWSGILISGEDKWVDARHSWNYLQVVACQAGRITNWFVSRPDAFFSLWSGLALKKYVLPYLQAKLKVLPSQFSVEEFILSQSEVFRTDWDWLRGISRPNVDETALKNWLCLHPKDATAKMPEVISLPFCGSDYDTTRLAVYHNVTHGLQKLNHQALEREEVGWVNLYNEAVQLPNINQVVPAVLRWETGPKTSHLINTDYADLFSWQA